MNSLAHQFKLFPSGRRYNLPKCATNGLKYSLDPAAISLLNHGIFVRFLFIVVLIDHVIMRLTNCPLGINDNDALILVPTLPTMSFSHKRFGGRFVGHMKLKVQHQRSARF